MAEKKSTNKPIKMKTEIGFPLRAICALFLLFFLFSSRFNICSRTSSFPCRSKLSKLMTHFSFSDLTTNRTFSIVHFEFKILVTFFFIDFVLSFFFFPLPLSQQGKDKDFCQNTFSTGFSEFTCRSEFYLNQASTGGSNSLISQNEILLVWFCLFMLFPLKCSATLFGFSLPAHGRRISFTH